MQWGIIFANLAWSDTTDNDDTSVESTEVNITESESEESVQADEEITVYGQREVDRRRSLLNQQLDHNGYREGIRRNNKVIYRPDTVWHPSVIVYDSGWVDLRRTPPRFEPWIGGHPDNKWRYISCIPPFGLMCIKASGWLISKRRAQHSKTAVIDGNIETIKYWQDSVFGLANQQRIEVDLPNELDRIWMLNDTPEALKLETIITIWSTRTCTPEGKQAAKVIADFLTYEVHPSMGLPDETIDWMKSNNPCLHSLPNID